MSGRLACHLSFPILLGLVPTFCFGLEWQQRENYRIGSLPVPAAARTGFTLMTNQNHGIVFTNSLPLTRAKVNNNLLNGAGVAAGDFDGDGWCDLYFCNLDGPNALYRNLGNWQFEDVTVSSGTACPGQASTGAV